MYINIAMIIVLPWFGNNGLAQNGVRNAYLMAEMTSNMS